MAAVHLFLDFWPVVVVLVGAIGIVALAIYRLRQVELRIRAHAIALKKLQVQRLQDYKDIKKAMDARLYHTGGELRYVTASLCGNMRDSCGVHITENFNALNARLQQMEARWEKVLERLAGGIKSGSET